MTMRHCLYAALFGVMILLQVSAQAQPLGRPGTVARYELAEPLEDRPSFEREHRLSVVEAAIHLGPVVRVCGEKKRQWYGLVFTRLNGDTYRTWILLDGWPMAEEDPGVYRYLWQEPGWPDALNYIHAVTGEPQLPRLCLWTYGWPQDPEEGGGSNRAPVMGTPEIILLQGWRFERVEKTREPDTGPPTVYTDLELNPDLLNGWLTFDRDADGRPWYRMDGPEGPGTGRYAYVAKAPEELKAYADAGANFVSTHPGDRAEENFPEWLTRSSMYHNNLAYEPLDWPADLYRPNYWGFSHHVDEPGVHTWGLGFDDDPDAPLPELQVVKHLQKVVRKGVEERGGKNVNERFQDNFGLGVLELEEGPEFIRTWEYEWPTAWYQLAVEDGVGGIVDEDAATNDLVETYNMGLGTEIPPTVENAVALRVAVLRGAARNFHKRWGVAFYHPNEVKLKSATIPLLYEKGAHAFWYWSGWIGITDNSGLPYPYQLYYASLVRQAFERNPDRDLDALLKAARVAVVIPYGYTFTPYHMHRIDWLHLERRNHFGVTYRRVLSNAAMEVERLIRMGIEFDIAVDDPLFHKTGYDELVYAQADGKVRIERPDGSVTLRGGPRPFERPYLGPGPKLGIELVDSDDGDPGELRFRAVAEIGTGEWSGERPEPLISWEVYGPDNRVAPSIFPEYGQERTLDLDDNVRHTMRHPVPEHIREQGNNDATTEGAYTVRAATADIFGRPAVAYRTVYLSSVPEGE